ncbi:ANTH-domain-containing protein [Wolfiporia cocos MD-104 SS10]|uniref:ANTH-domain-containing protein n=1 Tax=Wolfiporia cocos (strain MD-104) TaxID=742152 RepID=A0A2H3JPJ8_WOLCO|nr:ANTH-domain-containing protein [Wolfiporia cocos MD-104 SS10]
MTSYEKAIKGACKPKPNPPKAKYLDPILAATWSEDGAVHDVCKALIPRFREPNSLVVFKALIVLHSMIRNGATDNVLSYLSSSDILRLKNVSAGSWEGYNAPQNLQHYATYLDARIRAYRDLRHDAIRVQAENNRDMRVSQAVEEEQNRSTRSRSRPKDLPDEFGGGGGVQRSKTLAGRKLRIMTVEKGLLRETKIVQRMIDALVECRFYLDDLDNELNMTALRMLVKDLLILFQACNEGVINVLEHYFEMFRSDAEEALNIYRHFCKETERVVEYLGVAKKLQNILQVSIPNLRHAPVSLAGALEEYLKDPNFEQNRIEYKANKEAAERSERLGISAPPKQASKPADNPAEKKPEASSEASSSQAAPAKSSQAMIDFFSAIEGEQQSMFNPQTNSPSTAYFEQHAAHNPFAQHQMQMMTGAPFGAVQPFVQPQGQMQMQMQPTGFIVPQHTSTNPFGMQMAQQQQQQQQPAPFVQPQHTAFLQPQTTGSNPFRQSMFPQMTGMSPLGMGQHPPLPTQQPISTNPFPTQNTGFQGSPNTPNFSMFSPMTGPSQIAAPIAQSAGNPYNAGPARPASAPLSAIPAASSSGPPPANPIKTHQTGSRNPFGTPIAAPPPPVPKPPTLFELAMGTGQSSQPNGTQNQQQTSPTASGFGTGAFGSQPGVQPMGTAMSNVASSFTFNTPGESNGTTGSTSPLLPQPTSTGSTFSDSLFSSLSSQPTGATATSFGSSTSLLQPQKTGFGGLKPFKPSSSFGAALLESLPPIPQSAPTTPGETPQSSLTSPTQNGTTSNGLPGMNSQQNSALGSQPTGAFGSQPTGAFGSLGKSPGVGLRPQMTGSAGAANPFRATMFTATSSATSSGFGAGNAGMPSFLTSTPTGGGLGSSLFGAGNSGTGAPPFSPGQFGALGGMGQNASSFQPQQQQNGSASLI